jgi:hypothetical protein
MAGCWGLLRGGSIGRIFLLYTAIVGLIDGILEKDSHEEDVYSLKIL